MTTKNELLARMIGPEDNFTERKSQGVNASELRRTMVAFANSVPEGREAILFVGIGSDGEIGGVTNPDELQLRVGRICAEDCYPPIWFRAEVLDCAGAHVVAFVVPSSNIRPHFAGPAYVRRGSASVVATEEVYEDLLASRHSVANQLVRHKGEVVTVTVIEKRLGDRRPQRLANYREVHEGTIIACTPHLVTIRSNSIGDVSEPIANILLARDMVANRLEIIVPEIRIFRDEQVLDERAALVVPNVIGSAMRGTILHKLMEEVLTGELSADVERLTIRAIELLTQLDHDPAAGNKGDIVPAELATTILRTLNLPEIAELRPRLLPEFRVYGSETSGNGEMLTSGIADAIALGTDASINVVIDWKSDVDLDAARLDHYRGQLATYRKATGATLALLVMMTTGRVIELT